MAPCERSKKSANFVEPYVNELGIKIKDAQEQCRWENLSDHRKKVQTTPFVSMDALRPLGLYDIVRRFFQRSGMLDLLEKCDLTYYRLVIEFLVTVIVKNDKYKFRLLNEKYTMTSREMSIAFGCRPVPSEPVFAELSDEECAHFWLDVTNERPAAGGSVSSSMAPLFACYSWDLGYSLLWSRE